LTQANIDQINDKNSNYKIAMNKVIEMKSVEDLSPSKKLNWIDENIPEKEPIFKESLDFYSSCTLLSACNRIVNSGNDFSYDKLKESVNDMFRIIKLNSDKDKESELLEVEKQIESYIYLINFLLPVLSRQNG
jgi:hypothetical protein